MSFEHRFGVGISGSHEDPFIPPCCDDCDDPDCPGCNVICERYSRWVQYQEGAAREQLHEPPEEQE